MGISVERCNIMISVQKMRVGHERQSISQNQPCVCREDDDAAMDRISEWGSLVSERPICVFDSVQMANMSFLTQDDVIYYLKGPAQ